MNKIFRRRLLEDIDAFNYLDPNCFKPRDKSEKESDEELRPECINDHEKNDKRKSKKSKKSKSKKEASKKDFDPVFKSQRNAVDLRRFLQYSNAQNE
jgi:hypothetical protein